MLKKELLALAKELKIKGRSKLTKPQLIAAIKEAGGDVDDDKDKDKDKDKEKKMKQAKINEIYKVDTPPVKKVVKRVVKKADPKMTQVQQKMKEVAAEAKRPKIAAQVKAKMQEVQAERKSK